jgi:hypothetical protein
LGRLIGGPLGGLLLAAGSLRTIVVADALSFLVAAWLIARIPGGRPRPDRSRLPPSTGAERLSLRAALRPPRIRAALVVAFVGEIAQGIFVVLFILFVAQRLHGGSDEIGVLRGVQAIGAIGGGLALTVMARAVSPGALVTAGLLAFGAVDLAIWNGPAVTTTTGVYAGLFIVAGAPGVALETGLISTFQLAAPDRARGRVFGLLGLVSSVGQAIGMLAAGALTPTLGLMTLLNAQGLLYVGAGVIAAGWLTRARSAAGLPTSSDDGPRPDPPPGGGRGASLAGDGPAAGTRRLAAAGDPRT